MSEPRIRPEIVEHYHLQDESARLEQSIGMLERERTREIIARWLPDPPARVLDVGGAAGVHARWLAEMGHEVHLIDPVEHHVEQARKHERIASCTVGVARHLEHADASVDVALLLGPLYHLPEREERDRALGEAWRVLRAGGMLFAAGISRFASALDGMREGRLGEDEFFGIVNGDLDTGRHENPGNDPINFTTAFMHTPEQLEAEMVAAGFAVPEGGGVIAVEGPAWLSQNFEPMWDDEKGRACLLAVLRRIEREPSLLGSSAHLLAVGRKPE
jgi:SAM-dependent methyltransferase